MITKKDIAKLEGLLMLVAVSENNSKKKVAEALNLSVDTLNISAIWKRSLEPSW